MARPITKKLLVRGLKTIVGVLVVAAVAWHVRRTWIEIIKNGGPPAVDTRWVGVSIGLYLVALLLLAVYYVRVLAASSTPISPYPGTRAYVVSHLGKYVPGKAIVVLMRVGMSANAGVRASTATIATFYETLVMMAVGGVFSFFALTFASAGDARVPLPKMGLLTEIQVPTGLIGLGIGLGFFFLVLPPVFPRVAKLFLKPFRDVGDDAHPRLSWRLLAEGVVLTLLGWVAMGLSQVAILRAFSAEPLGPNLWFAVMGSVALATAAGFAVPISPGGLGIREWVLWTCLGSVIDQQLAVLASLGLRLAWVAAELLAGIAFAAFRPRLTTAGVTS